MTVFDKLRAARRDRHAFPTGVTFTTFVCLFVAVVAAEVGARTASQFFAVLAVVLAVLALAGLLVGYYQEVRRRHAPH